MVLLQSILLFALDVVSGPYVHCSAPCSHGSFPLREAGVVPSSESGQRRTSSLPSGVAHNHRTQGDPSQQQQRHNCNSHDGVHSSKGGGALSSLAGRCGAVPGTSSDDHGGRNGAGLNSDAFVERVRSFADLTAAAAAAAASPSLASSSCVLSSLSQSDPGSRDGDGEEVTEGASGVVSFAMGTSAPFLDDDGVGSGEGGRLSGSLPHSRSSPRLPPMIPSTGSSLLSAPNAAAATISATTGFFPLVIPPSCSPPLAGGYPVRSSRPPTHPATPVLSSYRSASGDAAGPNDKNSLSRHASQAQRARKHQRRKSKGTRYPRQEEAEEDESLSYQQNQNQERESASVTHVGAAEDAFSGFADIFIPRSEFCRRVLWLCPAESGMLYLYFPEEIPGEHYQRKTLRYSLCFVFSIDETLMTVGEQLMWRLVQPYTVVLMNVAEELRDAERKYGYVSRGLARVDTPPMSAPSPTLNKKTVRAAKDRLVAVERGPSRLDNDRSPSSHPIKSPQPLPTVYVESHDTGKRRKNHKRRSEAGSGNSANRSDMSVEEASGRDRVLSRRANSSRASSISTASCSASAAQLSLSTAAGTSANEATFATDSWKARSSSSTSFRTRLLRPTPLDSQNQQQQQQQHQQSPQPSGQLTQEESVASDSLASTLSHPHTQQPRHSTSTVGIGGFTAPSRNIAPTVHHHTVLNCFVTPSTEHKWVPLEVFISDLYGCLTCPSPVIANLDVGAAPEEQDDEVEGKMNNNNRSSAQPLTASSMSAATSASDSVTAISAGLASPLPFAKPKRGARQRSRRIIHKRGGQDDAAGHEQQHQPLEEEPFSATLFSPLTYSTWRNANWDTNQWCSTASQGMNDMTKALEGIRHKEDHRSLFCVNKKNDRDGEQDGNNDGTVTRTRSQEARRRRKLAAALLDGRHDDVIWGLAKPDHASRCSKKAKRRKSVLSLRSSRDATAAAGVARNGGDSCGVAHKKNQGEEENEGGDCRQQGTSTTQAKAMVTNSISALSRDRTVLYLSDRISFHARRMAPLETVRPVHLDEIPIPLVRYDPAALRCIDVAVERVFRLANGTRTVADIIFGLAMDTTTTLEEVYAYVLVQVEQRQLQISQEQQQQFSSTSPDCNDGCFLRSPKPRPQSYTNTPLLGVDTGDAALAFGNSVGGMAGGGATASRKRWSDVTPMMLPSSAHTATQQRQAAAAAITVDEAPFYVAVPLAGPLLSVKGLVKTSTSSSLALPQDHAAGRFVHVLVTLRAAHVGTPVGTASASCQPITSASSSLRAGQYPYAPSHHLNPIQPPPQQPLSLKLGSGIVGNSNSNENASSALGSTMFRSQTSGAFLQHSLNSGGGGGNAGAAATTRPFPPSATTVETIQLELPEHWLHMSRIAAEALLHLDLTHALKLLKPTTPHTTFQPTHAFNAILLDYKHPARRTIGAYMLFVAEQVREERRALRQHHKQQQQQQQQKAVRAEEGRGAVAGTGRNSHPLRRVSKECGYEEEEKTGNMFTSMLGFSTNSAAVGGGGGGANAATIGMTVPTGEASSSYSQLERRAGGDDQQSGSSSGGGTRRSSLTLNSPLAHSSSFSCSRTHAASASIAVVPPTSLPAVPRSTATVLAGSVGSLAPVPAAHGLPAIASTPASLVAEALSRSGRSVLIHALSVSHEGRTRLTLTSNPENMAASGSIKPGQELMTEKKNLAFLTGHMHDDKDNLMMDSNNDDDDETDSTTLSSSSSSSSSSDGDGENEESLIANKCHISATVGGKGSAPRSPALCRGGTSTTSPSHEVLEGIAKVSTSSSSLSRPPAQNVTSEVSGIYHESQQQLPTIIVTHGLADLSELPQKQQKQPGYDEPLGTRMLRTKQCRGSDRGREGKEKETGGIVPAIGFSTNEEMRGGRGFNSDAAAAASMTGNAARRASLKYEREVQVATSAAMCALAKLVSSSVLAMQREMRLMPGWGECFERWCTPCCLTLVQLALLNEWLVGLPVEHEE